MNSLALGILIMAQPPADFGQPLPPPDPVPGFRELPAPPPGAGFQEFPDPRPIYPEGLPGPVPSLVPAGPVLPVFDRIPTHEEFAAAFKPAPGVYRVMMLHPRTCKPVEVCFRLPPGCPRVEVNRRMIEYDYGDLEVEIRFRLFGKVTVDYDD